MSARILLVASLVLGCKAAAPETTRSGVGTPAQETTTTTTSTPREWIAIGDSTLYAEAKLELTGARTRSIHAAPSACSRGEDGSLELGLFATDVELKGKGHSWTFVAGRTKRGYGIALLEGEFDEKQTSFEWFGTPQGGLAGPTNEPFEIDVELREVGGDGLVRVRGTLRCPVRETSSRIPADVAAILRDLSGGELRDHIIDPDTRERDVRVVAVRVKDADAAFTLVAEVRKRLPRGYTAFAHNHDVLAGPTDVVVAAVKDQFDILRYARTNGAKHGLMTEGLIQRLHAWHVRYGLDIVHAEYDAVTFTMLRPPKPGVEFAREVLEVCPDCEYEVARSFEELVAMVESGDMYLWWD